MIYVSKVSLKLAYHSDSITRSDKYKLRKHRFIMTYESTIFLHVLLIFGIVYLTMLLILTLSTCSKHAWTGSGQTKIMFRDCNHGIPNPGIPDRFSIPGLCETKSRDFGIKISRNVMCWKARFTTKIQAIRLRCCCGTCGVKSRVDFNRKSVQRGALL